MSEEKTNENAFAEAKEALENAKDTVSDAREAVRKFKRRHKIRKGAEPKDDKTKAELAELDATLVAAQEAKDFAEASVKELKPAKGAGGGGEKYGYAQIKDKESGEMRDIEKSEKKRWRAHARKIAKKEDNDFTDPSEVPFDPTWFDPKPKTEKVKKEKTDDASTDDASTDDAQAEEKPERKSRRKKKEPTEDAE